MRKKNLILVIGILMCITLVFMEQARAIVFPDPTTSINGIPVSSQHTDFYSFSLPILGYSVPATRGQIKDDIVIATGPGHGPATTNIAGMDHAYITPVPDTVYAFSTGTTLDPGEESFFVGDADGTWDITLDTLINYLDGSDLVFFFNHNETGGEDDLYVWGRVEIYGAGKTSRYFYFADATGVPAELDPAIELEENEIPLQYVLAPSDICVGGQCFEHNLGAAKAAYAVFSPELNAGLTGWHVAGYTTLRGDFRLAALNGGYEQLFIQAGHTIIPEPTTMFLLGSGLLGLAGFGFRKKRKA